MHILGREVTVTVDRRLGTYHPNHPDLHYPVNYGYIAGILAPDGEEQDAYILGVNEPVASFTGVVIAIVRRADDVEEKWVVAPRNTSFSREEIAAQIRFQEQYFQSELIMSPLQKVIVIGCPGSGKSTFARTLHDMTGLPLHHLDRMYWNSDRTIVPKPEFRARLNDVLATDRWIIDGNYGSTMELRMAACDTVFFLDYPTDVCLDGIRARRGKPRPDLPWVEEDEDEKFLDFIRGYATTDKPKIMALLQRHSDKTVHIFRTRAEAEAFLSAIR